MGIGIISGLTRGFKRGIYRFVLTAIVFAVSVAVLPMVLDFIMTFDFSKIKGLSDVAVDGKAVKNLEELLVAYANKLAEGYISDVSDLAAIQDLIVGLPKMLASVVVFGVLFILIYLISGLIYLLTRNLVDSKENGKKFKNMKLLGGLVGGLSGLLIAFTAISPLLGAASVLLPYSKSETVRKYIDKLPPQAIEAIDDYLNYDGFVKKIFGYKDLDEKFFDRLTRTEINGEEVVASDLAEFSVIIDDVMYFIENGKDIPNMSDEQLAAAVVRAKNIVGVLFENGFSRTILKDVIKYVDVHSAEYVDKIPQAELRPFLTAVIDTLLPSDDYGANLDNVKQAIGSILDLAVILKDDAVYLINNIGKVGSLLEGNGSDELLSRVESAFKVLMNDTGAIGAIFESEIMLLGDSGQLARWIDGMSDSMVKPVLKDVYTAVWAPGTDKQYAAVKTDLLAAVHMISDLIADANNVLNTLQNLEVEDSSFVGELF